jgi:hypothetical protein
MSLGKIAVLGVALVVILAGCTRPEDKASTLQIAVPKSMSSQKVGSQAFDALQHVIINVSGPGMPGPIVFNWDLYDGAAMLNSGTTPTAPGSFNLSIPQGSDRLIQVLAVYGESTATSGGGAMQFFYGDVLKTLSSTTETATIAVTSVGAGATIISGRIAGRYYGVGGATPTGPIDIIFRPPAGKPDLIVERSSIMAGWFQFFGLQGAKLGYRMKDGTLMFGDLVDLTTTSFPVGNSTLRAALPLHQALRYTSGSSTPVSMVEDPEIYIYGFFGDATSISGKAICKDAGSVFTSIKKSGGSALLTFANNTADPADLFVADLPSMYVQGGVPFGGASPCTTAIMANDPANRFISDLTFSALMLENGNDSSAGFRIPFTLSSSGAGSNWVTVYSVDAATMSISGNLLPGIPQVVDSFAVFKRSGFSDVHKDEAPCYELGAMGFVLAGEGAVTTPAYSVNVPVTSTETAAGVLFALCPKKAGVMAGQGIWIRGNVFSGASAGPPTQLAIKAPQAINGGGCAAIEIGLQDASFKSTTAPSATAVALSNTSTANAGAFYALSDTTCALTPLTAVSIPAGSSVVPLRYKSNNPSTGTENLSAVATALTTGTASFPTVSTGAMTALSTSAPFTPAVNICQLVSFAALQTNGSPVSTQAGSVSVSSSGTVTLWTDAGCAATPASLLAMSAGVSGGVYIKISGSGMGSVTATMNVGGINFLDLIAFTLP